MDPSSEVLKHLMVTMGGILFVLYVLGCLYDYINRRKDRKHPEIMGQYSFLYQGFSQKGGYRLQNDRFENSALEVHRNLIFQFCTFFPVRPYSAAQKPRKTYPRSLTWSRNKDEYAALPTAISSE